NQPQPFDGQRALEVLEASFRHPIRLIANALGVPPKAMIEMGKQHNVPVAALVGAKEHALRQVAAGVDILVVQGTEAGGHCGEVSTMVLVPEVIKAIKPIRDVPVLAAGGIMTGRQMAACMAMGAAGVWTGSVWLATVESETTEIFREKMIAASSRDAVRSKGRTGKPARQLRSVWTDAWDRGPDSPGALPMPLQSIISCDAFNSIDRAAAAGNAEARDLVTYVGGQGVGEIVDRPKDIAAGLEPLVLLEQAVRRAETDGGAKLLDELGSLDVVNFLSWRYRDPEKQLAARLGVTPAHCYYGPVGGESPI